MFGSFGVGKCTGGIGAMFGAVGKLSTSGLNGRSVGGGLLTLGPGLEEVVGPWLGLVVVTGPWFGLVVVTGPAPPPGAVGALVGPC